MNPLDRSQADLDNDDFCATPPVWVILERDSINPDPGAGTAHAGAHARVLCGVAGDVPYIAAFKEKHQAERFLERGDRRRALVPAALDTAEALVDFLEGAHRVGHANVCFDRDEGGPARLVPVGVLLEAARKRQGRRPAGAN